MIAFSSSGSGPVLVVGAGPAGATAALTLARAGVPVHLLDRSAFPRNKPCGGGISMRVLRRFPYLEAEIPRMASLAISRLRLEGPGGESALIESDLPAALMIRRLEFDARLVALAVEAGARLSTGVDIVSARENGNGDVTVTARDGRSFTASTVIAADGVHSVVARRLGLNPGWPATSVALDMMEETPRAILRDVDPSTLWVAYGYEPDTAHGTRELSKGYAYIFPKRDHLNIGIGYALSYFRDHVEKAPYELQRALVDRLAARGIVVGTSAREHFTPFLIPIGGPLRRPGRGRVLLAGDAGGFVNAFTAEGIYYAMVSGDVAGRTIVETDPADRALTERYRRAVDDEIGGELRDSVLIQRYFFGDRRRVARVIAGARTASPITRLVLDLATGRRSYRDVRRRIFARVPWLGAWRLREMVTRTHATTCLD